MLIKILLILGVASSIYIIIISSVNLINYNTNKFLTKIMKGHR